MSVMHELLLSETEELRATSVNVNWKIPVIQIKIN